MGKPAVAKRPLVSLRGPDKPKPETKKVMVSLRLEPEMMEYLGAAAKRMGVDRTAVLVAAAELDRDLDRRLRDVREEMGEYAETKGLTLERDLAEVLADLVRMGLTQKKGKR
jgi:hypothetical protein